MESLKREPLSLTSYKHRVSYLNPRSPRDTAKVTHFPQQEARELPELQHVPKSHLAGGVKGVKGGEYLYQHLHHPQQKNKTLN